MPFIDEATLHRISENARQARSEYGGGESSARGSAVRRGADVLEVAGAAGALAYANAALGAGGQLSFLAIPIDLWVALAGYGSAWLGWAGRAERDAEMVAHGAMAGYSARLGAAWGSANRVATQGQGVPEIVGASPGAFGPGMHVGADGRTYVVSEVAAR